MGRTVTWRYEIGSSNFVPGGIAAATSISASMVGTSVSPTQCSPRSGDLNCNFHREATKSAKLVFVKGLLRGLCAFAVDFAFLAQLDSARRLQSREAGAGVLQFGLVGVGLGPGVEKAPG